MGRQDFEAIRGRLLPLLERLTVEEHRAVLGTERWAPPEAYRWIRFEDPDPVGRLLHAGERLEALWPRRPAAAQAEFLERERTLLGEAVGVARELGYYA